MTFWSIWGFFYTYFALNLGRDPISCEVYTDDSIQYGKIIQDEPDAWHDYEDVAANFRFGFMLLSISLAVNISAWILNHICYAKKFVRSFIIVFFSLPAIVMGIFAWFYLIIERYSYTGAVCSGDYLPEGDILSEDHDTNGYLIEQG